MAEYIDREVFKKSIEEHYCLPCKEVGKDYNGCRCRACWVDDMLDEVDCFQSAADVSPVVHGRWVEKEKYTFGIMYDCSLCENRILDTGHPWHYCPNCGAKMDEPVGNSDRLEENKE